MRRQLLAYAARRPRVGGSASSSTAAIEVAGLNVEWSGALAGGEPERAWGVRYGRSGDDEALAAPQPLRVSLELPLGSGEVELSVSGGPVSLGLLGVREGDLGLSDVASSTVQADVALRLTADGRRVKGHGTGKLSKLALEQPWLAKQRVHDLELGLRGRGELALDGTRVDIEQGELTVGSVKLEAKGVIERQRVGAELHTTATLEGGIPLASCQAILDSLPAGLAPLLEGMRMSGTFSLTGRIELDTRRPQDVVTRWALANECRITAVPQGGA